jgi:hypothetical protein
MFCKIKVVMPKKITFTVTVYSRDKNGVLYGDGASTAFKGNLEDWLALKNESVGFAFMKEAAHGSVCHVRYAYGRLRTTVYRTPNFNGTWRE